MQSYDQRIRDRICEIGGEEWLDRLESSHNLSDQEREISTCLDMLKKIQNGCDISPGLSREDCVISLYKKINSFLDEYSSPYGKQNGGDLNDER